MIEQKILSIIIVTWNTKQLIEDCIDSIISLPEYTDDFEIILIDNNSTDGTDKLVKGKYNKLIYIRNDSNKGYAPAVNQGINTSKGKYILLLGSDTVLKPGSLNTCISFLSNNSNAGAVGCKLVYPDGTLQSNCKRFPSFKNGFYTYLSLRKLNYDYDMQWFKYDVTMKVDQIATTFLMINGKVLRKLKGFDERYRIMYNDVDLCYRIRKSNMEIYFLPDAEIIHHGCSSTRKADYKVRRIMYEDIFRYYKSNFGNKSILLLPVLKIRLFLTSLFK